MRFTKFGKALCMGALSAGVVFGITSCVESYTVGFLYVTGTVTASSGSNGIISGYKIDHNTGKLTTIQACLFLQVAPTRCAPFSPRAAGFFMFLTAACPPRAAPIATERAPTSA